MKRKIAVLVVTMLCFLTMLPMTASATESAATLSGPKTVRAGDTMTLDFNINGSGILGSSGTLQYDADKLTLVSMVQKIGAPWVVEFNENNFVAYDNNLSDPINAEKTIFSATFTVKELEVGTKIEVSCSNVTVSDGSKDTDLGTVTYSRSVAAPLSDDASLASLVVSNATISPAFSPEITEYTAVVPFSVSQLNISALPNDTKGSVSVYSPNLVPGGITKATITVTAQNGATKTYTISVTREGNPNYIPNTNNKLSSINVEGFLLSPAFNAEITEYVVWLPYEISEIKISGTAADTRASVEVVGRNELAAGHDNIVKVICTAESGEKRVYNITVKRAAAHDGSVDEKPDEPTESTPADTSSETPVNSDTVKVGVAWYWLLVVGFTALLVGIILGFFGKKWLNS